MRKRFHYAGMLKRLLTEFERVPRHRLQGDNAPAVSESSGFPTLAGVKLPPVCAPRIMPTNSKARHNHWKPEPLPGWPFSPSQMNRKTN